MESLEKYRSVLIAVGIAVAIVVVAVAVRGGDGDESAEAIPTTSTGPVGVTSTTSDESVHNPDVPPIECRAILITEDIEVALNVWDRPGGPVSSIGFSQGETCGETLDGDDLSFVRLEPGSPADFEPGAVFYGSGLGTAVEIGDAGIWFAGSGADEHAGLLAVRAKSTLGRLHFRLYIGRPELDDADRREVAVDLASRMLHRFPGVAPPDPEVITFDESPDEIVAEPSLLDLVTAGVEADEWTMGGGLTALLDWVANGTPGVVPAGGPSFASTATGLIAAAGGYLAGNPSDVADIEAMLDQLTPTVAELEEMTQPGAASSPPLLVSAAPVAQEEHTQPCDEFALDTPCLEKITLPTESGIDVDKYSLYAALSENSQWSIDDVEVAKKALIDSAITYEALGEMPQTALVLRPGGESLYASYVPGEDCRVYVSEFLAGTEEDELAQILAREIAFCLIANDFFPQFFENPHPTEWLAYGLANYLSGVVYSSNDLEHENLPEWLAQSELATTVPDRSWTNWIVFEHFTAFVTPPGVTEMIRQLPAAGDLVTALAGTAAVAEMYHDLGRALSDANVVDLGGGTVPYQPQAWELPLGGPAEIPFTVPQFGVRRLHIQVPPGMYACVGTITQGELRVSWRPGAPGEPGSWSDEVPLSLEDESVLVVTSVQPGAHFTLDVEDVADEPDCEEPAEETDEEACDLDAICDPSRYYWRIGPGN